MKRTIDDQQSFVSANSARLVYQLSEIVASMFWFGRLYDQSNRVFSLNDLIDLNTRCYDFLFLFKPFDCRLRLAASYFHYKLGFLSLSNSDIFEFAAYFWCFLIREEIKTKLKSSVLFNSSNAYSK